MLPVDPYWYFGDTLLSLAVSSNGISVEVQVQVYLRENAPQSDIDSLMSYIRSKPYASTAEHVTKEMAKEKFLKEGNEDWNKVLDYNPLPASIDFSLKSEYVNKDTLNSITADLSQNLIVSEIRYPGEVVSNLNNVVRKVGWVLLGAVTLLGILVLILIDNTIKLLCSVTVSLLKPCNGGPPRWFISAFRHVPL